MSILSTEYANYLLRFPWDLYVTQTFRRRRNDPVNSALAFGGILERLDWSRSFVAVEYHKLGGVHLHALVADDLIDWSGRHVHNYVRARIQGTQKYLTKAFGWASCSQANNQATVNMYCAKYVTKDNGDYFFLGDWNPDIFPGEKAQTP